MAPAETVARYRKHVSPLTGVVSHLERIKSEQPLDASFIAKAQFFAASRNRRSARSPA